MTTLACRSLRQARPSTRLQNATRSRSVIRPPKAFQPSSSSRSYASGAQQTAASFNRYLTPALLAAVVASAGYWALASPAAAKPKSKAAEVPKPSRSAFTRDDATVVVILGGPSTGKTAHAKKIARQFDMQYEDSESDIYSDIALNIPTAKQGHSHNGKLRLIIDDFPSPAASASGDPLESMRWFEDHVAPICVIVFVDCPPEAAEKRQKGAGEKMEAWKKHIGPVIDHYRHKGNILEITGEWPADEQWEQIEAKLESAMELEARGEL